MKIRKLIGNGGYRRGSLEVFFPWKRRLNWGWLLNHMVLVMWIDALRQANMCCASLSPLFGGYAQEKKKTSGFASWLHASLSIWLGMMAKSLWFCISNAPYSSIQYSVIHCQSITTEEVGTAIFKIICTCVCVQIRFSLAYYQNS